MPMPPQARMPVPLGGHSAISPPALPSLHRHIHRLDHVPRVPAAVPPWVGGLRLSRAVRRPGHERDLPPRGVPPRVPPPPPGELAQVRVEFGVGPRLAAV